MNICIKLYQSSSSCPQYSVQPWYVTVILTFLVMVSMPAFSVVEGKLSGVFQPLLKQIEFDNNLMQSFSKSWDYTRRDNLMRFILLHIKNFAGRQSRYVYTTNMHGTQGSADLFKPKIKSKNVPLRKNLCFFCSNDNKKGVYAESFFENFCI